MINFTVQEKVALDRATAGLREEFLDARRVIAEETGSTEEKLIQAFGAMMMTDPTHLAKIMAYLLVAGVPEDMDARP